MPQTPDYVPIVSGTGWIPFPQFPRKPDLSVIRKIEAGRQHTYDGNGMLQNRQSELRKIIRPAQKVFPVSVTNQGYGSAAELMLRVREASAQNRLYTHHSKEIFGGESDWNARRSRSGRCFSGDRS